MGGVGAGACAIYVLRNGIRVCVHSKPKYDRLIKATGAFYLKPINGVLSTLDASAGTHSRYGACDIEGDGYTKDTLVSVAKLFRDEAFLAYPRLWAGNFHIHVADAACPNMAPTLAAQFALFAKGYDALVGDGPDPLGGYKRDLVMSVFNAKPTPVPAPAPEASTVKVNDYTFPFTYKPGWYPYPGAQGKSYYGPSKAGNPWYSGKTAGGSKSGLVDSGSLTLPRLRSHIGRIQKCVGVPVDGTYGPMTVAAVQRWQHAHGMTADGITGPRTWAAMAQSHHQ